MSLELPSEFLVYLAKEAMSPGNRLPSIQELSELLQISTGKLREQIEVARQLGLIEVRPKTGIRVLPYSFCSAIRTGLLFAISLDQDFFYQFGVLRNHVEASFWHEAVELLEEQDHGDLERLLDQAWEKLRGYPIQIPHDEHRELHLTIYKRLSNPFVVGLLEAYWEAYEAVGLNMYTDYSYLESVWNYHDAMVRSILEGDVNAGYRALIEHTKLLQNRPEIARYSSEDGYRLIQGIS